MTGRIFEIRFGDRVATLISAPPFRFLGGIGEGRKS